MIKLRMVLCNIQLELNIKVNLEMANDVLLVIILGGHGKFTFPNQKVQYEGHFENDTFHGKGTLTILKTKETLEVEYELGKCKTDLPENFKLAFQKDKPNS
jgi:hypothetical protein